MGVIHQQGAVTEIRVTTGLIGPTLIGPSTIEIMLEAVGSYFESDQHIRATPITAIVAVDDGRTWAGVTDLLLPFP